MNENFIIMIVIGFGLAFIIFIVKILPSLQKSVKEGMKKHQQILKGLNEVANRFNGEMTQVLGTPRAIHGKCQKHDLDIYFSPRGRYDSGITIISLQYQGRLPHPITITPKIHFKKKTSSTFDPFEFDENFKVKCKDKSIIQSIIDSNMKLKILELAKIGRITCISLQPQGVVFSATGWITDKDMLSRAISTVEEIVEKLEKI